MLRASGAQVEVQNYIDNTGVQVADVVVGFHFLEHKTTADVEALLADPAVRFDYYCWICTRTLRAITKSSRNRSHGAVRRCMRSRPAKASWHGWRIWWRTLSSRRI